MDTVHRDILNESGNTKVVVGWFAFVISFVSLFLNFPIFFSVFSKNKRPPLASITTKGNADAWKMDMKLIALISFMDLMLGISICIFQIIRAASDYNVYTSQKIYCQVEGFVSTCLIHTSLYAVSLLSFERYSLIVLKKKWPNYFYWTLLIIVAGITWLLAFISAKNHEFQLMPSGTYCLLHYGNSFGSTAITIFTIEGFLSCVFLTFFYIEIMMCRRSQNKELQKVLNNKNSISLNSLDSLERMENLEKTRNTNRIAKVKSKLRGMFKSPNFTSEDNKVAYRIILIITIYLSCLFPEVIAFLYELITGKPRSIILDSITICAIMFTVVGNAFLVLVLHKQTRININNFAQKSYFGKK